MQSILMLGGSGGMSLKIDALRLNVVRGILKCLLATVKWYFEVFIFYG